MLLLAWEVVEFPQNLLLGRLNSRALLGVADGIPLLLFILELVLVVLDIRAGSADFGFLVRVFVLFLVAEIHQVIVLVRLVELRLLSGGGVRLLLVLIVINVAVVHL